MEYEGTFTEADAENDGEIKRYAGKQSAQIAARQNSQLYQMFQNVCEEKGLDPWEVLGDHIVRALNNESHAEMLANTEVNMSKLQQGSVRMEDAKFLKEFAETLGISIAEEKDDSGLDDIFEQRLRSQLQSPFSGMSDKSGNSNDEELMKEIKRLRRELDEVKSGGDSGGAPDREYVRQDDVAEKDVDEAFDSAMEGITEDESSEAEVVSTEKVSEEAVDEDVEDGGEEDDGDIVEDRQEFSDNFSVEPDIADRKVENDIPASKDAEEEEEDA